MGDSSFFHVLIVASLFMHLIYALLIFTPSQNCSRRIRLNKNFSPAFCSLSLLRPAGSPDTGSLQLQGIALCLVGSARSPDRLTAALPSCIASTASLMKHSEELLFCSFSVFHTSATNADSSVPLENAFFTKICITGKQPNQHFCLQWEFFPLTPLSKTGYFNISGTDEFP